jgi:hypothetical protein
LPACLLLVFVAFEMINYIPGSRPRRYDSATVPPYIRQLKTDASKFRTLAMNNFLYPNSSSLYNVDCINALDAMYPPGFLDFIHQLISPAVIDRFVGTEVAGPVLPILRYLSMMNVKYLITVSDFHTIGPVLLKNGSVTPSDRTGIVETSFLLNGQSKSVLLQHPPSTIICPLRVPAGAKLSFSIAISPDCWSPSKGDGVRFKIKMKDPKGIRVLFDKTIDPKNNAADRRWFYYGIDLKEFQNKEPELILETDPVQNSICDWAGWGDMELLPGAYTNALSLIYDKEVKIYRNDAAFPRAYIADKAVFVQNENESLRALKDPSLDLGRTAVVEKSEAHPRYSLSQTGPASTKDLVNIVNYSPDRIVVNTAYPNPGFLVLTDQYFPGWRAYVDGSQQPILKANYLFRAVYLGGGKHTVEFRYQPSSFRWGWICFLSAILLLAFSCYRRQ